MGLIFKQREIRNLREVFMFFLIIIKMKSWNLIIREPVVYG